MVSCSIRSAYLTNAVVWISLVFYTLVASTENSEAHSPQVFWFVLKPSYPWEGVEIRRVIWHACSLKIVYQWDQNEMSKAVLTCGGEDIYLGVIPVWLWNAGGESCLWVHLRICKPQVISALTGGCWVTPQRPPRSTSAPTNCSTAQGTHSNLFWLNLTHQS